MTQHPKSVAEVHIEELMHQLDPSSERYQVLDIAKRFKSSWVELGEQLVRVFREGLYQKWGHKSFEDYCAKEIRVKKATAQKLTMAYRFIKKEEPELLVRHNTFKPLPDYRSVDLLRKAKEENDFSAEEYEALRQAIVEEERSHPTIRKRFNEVAATKKPLEEELFANCKTTLSVARRLAKALENWEVIPDTHKNNVNEIIYLLETHLDTLNHQQDTSIAEKKHL